jgi:hypothetical protein
LKKKKKSFEALESIFEVKLVFFNVFQLGLLGNEEVARDVLAGNGDRPSPVSLPLGFVSPVVSTLLEQMGGLVFVLVYLVFLSLFYQNKLDYMSPRGWMLQNVSLANGLHSRGSLY